MDQCWLLLAICLVLFVPVNSQLAIFNLTFIEDAVERGAVCLDGTPGAYYFAAGFGSGINNWIIDLQGGGWCYSQRSCLDRSNSRYGSTKNASVETPFGTPFGTILSGDQATNPDFYDWNKVYVLYCDGASFMADVEEIDPENKLYRRGRRIFISVLEELLKRGMDLAENAFLIGNSAGGLATILNCDFFHSYLPLASRVKCFSDSGFFIRAKDLPESVAENYYRNVIEFHELAGVLPKSCTWRLSPHLCLFPENVVGDVETPLFLLNSDFDQYQVSMNLKPNPPNDKGWNNCTLAFDTTQRNCTATQFQLIKDFQTEFLKAIDGVLYNPSRGIFINSCFIHDFVTKKGNWQGVPTLQNLTIAQVLGDWYFERRIIVQFIDMEHPYPINCGH